MITLITAVPGSGKTLYAVSLIQDFLNEGRPVYQNIEGLQVDKFENNHLLFDAPDDWTETPDGSVVIYDECQQDHLYPATGERGKVLDHRLTKMETHRHTGHDLIFITQAPTFVHHHVRKLVGEHIHFYRGGGAKNVAKYTWSHTCDSPNDRREQERADFSIMRFDPKLYPLYKSATVHTHKFRIPKKILLLFIFISVLFGLVVYFAFQGNILSSLVLGDPVEDGGGPMPTLAGTAPPKPESVKRHSREWLDDVPEVRTLAGCAASAKFCQCWTSDMIPLDIPQDQCRAMLNSPLPRVINIGESKT